MKKVGELEKDFNMGTNTILGNYAYIQEGTKIRIYELTHPLLPRYRAELEAGGNNVIKISGDYAFIRYESFERGFVNLTNSAAPVTVNTFTFSQIICDYEIEGDYLYLASGTYSIVIMDIKDMLHTNSVAEYTLILSC